MLESTRNKVVATLGKVERELKSARQQEETLNAQVYNSGREPQIMAKWHKAFKKVEELSTIQQKLHNALQALK